MATTTRDRILTLDTVRGVAVMGILLLNIIAFAMPPAAYMNPRAYGGSEGLDLAVWLGNFILFDGKMRGLFSFLFGASTLLVIEGATAKGESAARVHYSRMIWLLVFGLLHCWLIWWGDILNQYAIIGMLAYFFRNSSAKRLMGFGIVFLVLQLLVALLMLMGLEFGRAGLVSPDPQTVRDAREMLAGFEQTFGVPPEAALTKDIAAHGGSWLDIARERFKTAGLAPFGTLFIFGFETLAYMLFGMAAFRSAMLTGGWDRRRYLRWVLIGFGIGIPAYAALAALIISQGFSMSAVMLGVIVLTIPVRPFMILAWASLIILLMRPGGALTTRIAAAGRMAFTNYLATSLICTTVFYGYGLGLYGELSRAQVYLVVFAVWAGMLLWSKPWLERFAYGPLEWLWRSLARGRIQPMAGGAL
ncbi:DUF418 domain-containing protein [Sphingomonas koreensis]|jgi:uncharacterized protein|uniref:DUF418 domain-containing protein n=1 Tax=Sphingomonas koreensis TaxID=93064 RepID=A0A1L6JC64_9SPHN|nr:DUF418 domain-containing protein [Sphingomonas koreensis]APR53541.1 hypothetical protein BRX40_14910 [Sphingomonas koreensis]MDC7809740.1 DUF418 domain-containing protein [Sphingomonas koreensis]RSU21001.1 DUF418 domain-containing protein [Sphingomonas koreensis]RSU22072.1 DUF418 domain-containing protein [Sphingomonas koreensis]RSU24326.1 DUF418 domain-containing protein [Sphingomonas koreensis]